MIYDTEYDMKLCNQRIFAIYVQVRILSSRPSLLYKIDDRPKKSDLSDFLRIRSRKNLYENRR